MPFTEKGEGKFSEKKIDFTAKGASFVDKGGREAFAIDGNTARVPEVRETKGISFVRTQEELLGQPGIAVEQQMDQQVEQTDTASAIFHDDRKPEQFQGQSISFRDDQRRTVFTEHSGQFSGTQVEVHNAIEYGLPVPDKFKADPGSAGRYVTTAGGGAAIEHVFNDKGGVSTNIELFKGKDQVDGRGFKAKGLDFIEKTEKFKEVVTPESNQAAASNIDDKAGSLIDIGIGHFDKQAARYHAIEDEAKAEVKGFNREIKAELKAEAKSKHPDGGNVQFKEEGTAQFTDRLGAFKDKISESFREKGTDRQGKSIFSDEKGAKPPKEASEGGPTRQSKVDRREAGSKSTSKKDMEKPTQPTSRKANRMSIPISMMALRIKEIGLRNLMTKGVQILLSRTSLARGQKKRMPPKVRLRKTS